MLSALFVADKMQNFFCKLVVMKWYDVKKCALFFSTDEPPIFMAKYVAVMYFLPDSKIVIRNYAHSEINILKIAQCPKAIELDENVVDQCEPNVPKLYTQFMKLWIPK